MQIKPILSAMLRTRTGPILIALQVAITLAIVANAAFIINERVEKMNRSTGMDDANLVFALSTGFGPGYEHMATVREDLEALRAMPGVRYAGFMNRPPLTGGGSSSSYYAVPEVEDAINTVAANWTLDETGPEVLGLELVAGRWFNKTEIELEDGTGPAPIAIVTRALAQELFDSDDVVGRNFYHGNGQPSRIVGVVEHMQGAWPNWDGLDQNVLYPGITESPNLGYALRVNPGEADRMVPLIEAKLQEINRDRVVISVRTLHEYMQRSYRNDSAMVQMLTGVSVLLVAVTALGIVGLAAFNVNQRKKQIGTRRALGARRVDILHHFLVESLLITSMGIVAGTLLAFGMSWWLGTQFNLPQLDWRFVPPVVLGVLVISQLAVLGPARRASGISPALATRSV